jgi:hypothetical protein
MSCGLTSETNRQNGRPSMLAREIKSSTLSPPTPGVCPEAPGVTPLT